MTTKTGLMYSPITKQILWGRSNEKGVSSGTPKDVTSSFLQVMEHKFPIDTCQNISINGENKYRVLVIRMGREVILDGKVIPEVTDYV
jgi:hypothetical protein